MKKIPLIKTKIKNNDIYIIELNNPKKRNPLSRDLISNLQREFDKLKDDKKIKVIIIQSSGPSFCSGHDLKEVKNAAHSKKELI